MTITEKLRDGRELVREVDPSITRGASLVIEPPTGETIVLVGTAEEATS